MTELVQWLSRALAPTIMSNIFSYSISHPIPVLGTSSVYVILLAIDAIGIWSSFGIMEDKK